MGQRMDVAIGMDVKSREGRTLGKVVSVADDAFVVERGVFFARDYRVPLRAVETINRGDIYLSLDRRQLREARLDEVMGVTGWLTPSPGAFADARMGPTASRDVLPADAREDLEEDVEEDLREEGPGRPIGFRVDPAPRG
jgi:hypothetical protein